MGPMTACGADDDTSCTPGLLTIHPPPRPLAPQFKKFWGSFGKSVKMGIIEDPSNR